MKTKDDFVTGNISIWALPRNPQYMEPGEFPFTYELSTSKDYHWKTGAVCVHTVEVTLELPGGVDLLSKAVETLESAKDQAFKEYSERIAAIDKQLDQLKLLSGPTDCIEG